MLLKGLPKPCDTTEKVLIYGDYDVDGTTSVALVYKFLKQFYSNVDFYIPTDITKVMAFLFRQLTLQLPMIFNRL